MPTASVDMEIPHNNTDSMHHPVASRWSGLYKRVVGILPSVAIAVLCVLGGGFYFSALVLLAAVIMLKEWETLTKNGSVELKMAGYPLIILPCSCLLWLRFLNPAYDTDLGMKLVFALIAIIAATDIGAYFTGKRFGRLKLAPVLSPNKTWEGLAGGVFAAMIMAALVLPLSLPLYTRFGTGMLLAVLAQTGDILESSVKRRAGVKDSGTIIPGHGGLLDRLDGYLLAAPAFAALIQIYKL